MADLAVEGRHKVTFTVATTGVSDEQSFRGLRPVAFVTNDGLDAGSHHLGFRVNFDGDVLPLVKGVDGSAVEFLVSVTTAEFIALTDAEQAYFKGVNKMHLRVEQTGGTNLQTQAAAEEIYMICEPIPVGQE